MQLPMEDEEIYALLVVDMQRDGPSETIFLEGVLDITDNTRAVVAAVVR